jgi:hypothetical protein
MLIPDLGFIENFLQKNDNYWKLHKEYLKKKPLKKLYSLRQFSTNFIDIEFHHTSMVFLANLGFYRKLFSNCPSTVVFRQPSRQRPRKSAIICPQNISEMRVDWWSGRWKIFVLLERDVIHILDWGDVFI